MTAAGLMSPEEFMAAAVPVAMPNSNTPFGARYAWEIRDVIIRQASRQPRTVQRTLGPSELGVKCHRQAIGKMSGWGRTNHVVDPWPSIVGTAVHALLAEFFARENALNGYERWIPEQRVYPTPDHPGTADLYDRTEEAVVDHKVLGESSLSKIKSADGPPRKYVVQLLLYGLGYMNAGKPVRRVVLAAYPRTSSSLDGLYIWDHPWSQADWDLIAEVLAETELRHAAARAIMAREITIYDIPMAPSDDECYFCPFYRPEAAWQRNRDDPRDQHGCPGHSLRE